MVDFGSPSVNIMSVITTSDDYKVRRPDVRADIRDMCTAAIKYAREHVCVDAVCTGCKRGSGCTQQTPHVFLADNDVRDAIAKHSRFRLEKRKPRKGKILRRDDVHLRRVQAA